MDGTPTGSRLGRFLPPTLPSGAAAGSLALLGLLVTVALLLAWVIVEDPELFRFEIEPSSAALVSLLVVAGLGAAMLWRPELALVLLVLAVYLNLSQVLVRYHSLPSLLQLLVFPLAAVAWFRPPQPGIRRDALPPPLTLLLVGYNLVLLFSSTQAHDARLADERWAENSKALVIYLLLLALCGASMRRITLAVWTLVGAATLLAGIGVLQVSSGDFQYEWGGLARVKEAHIHGRVFESRIAGPLGDPNFFAQILIIAVPLALALAWESPRLRSRVIAWGCAAVVLAGTILTYSRGAAVSLVLVLVLYLVLRRHRPRQALVGAAALLTVGLLAPGEFASRLLTVAQILPGEEQVLHPDSAFEERKLYVAVAWRIFLNRPLLGVGAGNYTDHYDRFADQVGSEARAYGDPEQRYYPHSLYLEIAAETGMLGLGVFGLVLAASFSGLRKARDRFMAAGDLFAAEIATGIALGLAGYLLAALFLHGHFPRYLWMLFALVGAVERSALRGEEAS